MDMSEELRVEKGRQIANVVRNLIISLFGFCLSTVLTCLAMIYGWGLEPKSWLWIIGAGVFGQFFAVSIIKLSNDSL